MRNISDTVVEKIKTPILCSTNIFRKSAIYEIMWKKLVVIQTTDDNMVHAHCMLNI